MQDGQADGGLAAELQELAIGDRSMRGRRCSVGALLERMAADSPDDGVALSQALDNREVPLVALGRVLNSHGFAVQSGTLARHRRRGEPTGCRCPR